MRVPALRAKSMNSDFAKTSVNSTSRGNARPVVNRERVPEALRRYVKRLVAPLTYGFQRAFALQASREDNLRQSNAALYSGSRGQPEHQEFRPSAFSAEPSADHRLAAEPRLLPLCHAPASPRVNSATYCGTFRSSLIVSTLLSEEGSVKTISPGAIPLSRAYASAMRTAARGIRRQIFGAHPYSHRGNHLQPLRVQAVVRSSDETMGNQRGYQEDCRQKNRRHAAAK